MTQESGLFSLLRKPGVRVGGTALSLVLVTGATNASCGGLQQSKLEKGCAVAVPDAKIGTDKNNSSVTALAAGRLGVAIAAAPHKTPATQSSVDAIIRSYTYQDIKYANPNKTNFPDSVNVGDPVDLPKLCVTVDQNGVVEQAPAS